MSKSLKTKIRNKVFNFRDWDKVNEQTWEQAKMDHESILKNLEIQRPIMVRSKLDPKLKIILFEYEYIRMEKNQKLKISDQISRKISIQISRKIWTNISRKIRNRSIVGVKRNVSNVIWNELRIVWNPISVKIRRDHE